MMVDDPTLYRVFVVCACNADVAYGYGPTEEAARACALTHFRKAHGRRARIGEVIVEKAVVHDELGGSHYEEVTP